MNLQDFQEKLAPTVNLLQEAGKYEVIQGIAVGLLLSKEVEGEELQVMLRALAVLPVMKFQASAEFLLKQVREQVPASAETEQAVIETVKNLLKEGY